MRQGYSMVLTFIRYTPKVATVGGKTVVTFDPDSISYHKVVPSGFQAGKYRLVLTDVGYTGVGRPECGGGEGCKPFNATLRSDLSVRMAELGVANATVVAPSGVAPVILEYDGDTGGQLFFIQHVDGLRLTAEP